MYAHTIWVQIRTKISGGSTTESQSAFNILVISVLTKWVVLAGDYVFFKYLQQTCAFMQMTLSFTLSLLLCCRPHYIICTCFFFFNPKNKPQKVHDLILRARLQTCGNVDSHSLGEELTERVSCICIFGLMIWLSLKVRTLNQVKKLKLKLGFFIIEIRPAFIYQSGKHLHRLLSVRVMDYGDIIGVSACYTKLFIHPAPLCPRWSALLVFIRPKATVALVYIYIQSHTG